jgi:oligopeptide transport system substrate-binding protein
MRSLPPLLALLVLLSGCFSSAASAPRHSASVLEWGIVGLSDIPTLDPALASDPTSISVASLLYGGLVRLDRNLHVQPDGARRWTISRDGLVYTFFIRHSLRFADGRPVTARDFAGALERALGPEGSAGTATSYLQLIAQRSAIAGGATRTTRGIDVLNRRTLRITLSHPAAHFLTELAFPASYVPDPLLAARYGSNWTDHAAGFGPFYVQSWQHGRYLTLARNPYYYGGRPALQQIRLHLYGSERSAMRAYQRGAVDVVSGLPAGQSVTAHVTGMQRTPALAMDYLAFNTTRLPFHRYNARWAFAAAAQPAMIARVMGNAVFPARSFLPSAFHLAVPITRASRIPSIYLARAHYPLGQGFPPTSLIIPRDASLRALAQHLRKAWKQQLGVDVQIRSLNPKNYGTVLDARSFDLALVRWGGDYPDPQDFLGTQLGSSASNVTGWAGHVYDDDIVVADSYHPTDPRRDQLFRQAAGIAERHVPLLPLDEPAVTAVIRPGLSGVHLTGLGTIYGDWAHARFTH